MPRGGNNTAAHTRLVAEILLAIGGRSDCRLWHQKHLRARAGRAWIHTGVDGMADLSGILSDGRRLEIEVKTGTGDLELAQQTWRDMVLRFGGVHIVARSVEDAVVGVELALRRRVAA